MTNRTGYAVTFAVAAATMPAALPMVSSAEIELALGIDRGSIGLSYALRFIVAALVVAPSASYVLQGGRRTRVAAIGAAVSLAAMLAAATAKDLTQFAALWALAGIGDALLTVCLGAPRHDEPDPSQAVGRRVVGVSAGVALGIVVWAVLGEFADLTWRGSLVAVVGVATPLTIAGLSMLDHDATESTREMGIGLFEVLRSQLTVMTVRTSLMRVALVAMAVVPILKHFTELLDDRWWSTTSEQRVALATVACGTATAIGLAMLVERTRAWSIRVVLGIGGIFILSGIAIEADLYTLMLILIGAGLAAGVLGATPTLIDLYGAVGRTELPAAAALVLMYGSLGATFGLLTLSSVEARLGSAVALGLTAIPLLFVALVTTVDPEQSASDAAAREQRELLVAKVDDPSSIPDETLLEVVDVSAGYGSVQVLFDVSIEVRPGEIVALLGTNGSGKSTLLKVVSGLLPATHGHVALDGVDITDADAEHRARMGISQISGGNAVFAHLTVAENIEIFAHGISFDGRLVDEGRDRVYAAFPELRERQSVRAGNLSGGQRQMLALSKALLLRPPLLLIDELSLGLAPSVVDQLLGTIQEINQQGTALLLVEQSVGVALNVAQRAYFLERGQVRFDGPTAELVERDDLVRSVFLDH